MELRIFDTTLRDGEQTPGVSLTPDDKLQIARQLDKLGVDTIEAGFPIVSKGEEEAVRLISKAELKSEICGLARCSQSDIDAAFRCDVDCIHVFIATSDLHLQHKLKITRDEALRRAVESVRYAKKLGVVVEFSAEDATRSELDYLKKVYLAAGEAGADRVNIPDTVGISYPASMASLVKEIKTTVTVPVSVHCHNDYGLAVANSLAGVEVGADQVHATINGIGERAGNASLEEVVVAAHQLLRRKTRINLNLLYETSRFVSRLTGVIVQPNKAIVGENAFGHESGIHTHGVISMPLTYEPFNPEIVGRKRWFQAGKHAGAHGVAAQLAEEGIYPTKEQLAEVMSRVKSLGDKGKTVTDVDLLAIAEAVIGGISEQQRAVTLLECAVTTGTNVVPMASVKINLNGTEYVASEVGVGPVDSAIKAIQKLTDQLVNVRLKEYRLEALTGGSDALAEVIVKVEDRDGNFVSAKAAREDIVLASVEAMIEAINKILIKKRVAQTARLKATTP